MPTIRITTACTSVAVDLARRIEERGLGDVQISTVPAVDAYEIVHRPGLGPGTLRALTDAIAPFVPPSWAPRAEALPRGVDVDLRLGDAAPLSKWNVAIYAEDPSLARDAQAALAELGMRVGGVSLQPVERSVVTYGGATPFARHLVRWWAARHGIELGEQKDWPDEDGDMFVQLLEPEAHARPVRERYGVKLRCDLPEVGEALASRLRGLGFRCVVEPCDAREIALDPGPFRKDRASSGDLRSALERIVREHGVDLERFPIQKETEGRGRGLEAVVTLPIGSIRDGRRRPYGGDFPERFAVEVRTDDAARARELVRRLEELRFAAVRLCVAEVGPPAWTIALGGLSRTSLLGLELVATVRAASGEETAEPSIFESPVGDDEHTIVIDAPFTAVDEATRAERVRAALRDVNVKIVHARSVDPAPLVSRLRAAGVDNVTMMRRPVPDSPSLLYGGAPAPAVAAVLSIAEPLLGAPLQPKCAWSRDDRDVFVEVASLRATSDGDAEANEAAALACDWRAPVAGTAREARPFVAVDEDRVHVGPVTLPRRRATDALVPGPQAIAEYCVDARTAETLLHVARCVALREPCALEGETSTSKTSAVLFLAALLGQTVVRLNLHGQTDTGELLGRYEPHDGAQGGRWRWRDGAIVRAIEHGHWVLLDELNLAEPQILERLNPILERAPSLVLSEHDGRAYGGRGAPIHPSFRLFATMNPAEYSGRSVLSPAYRDRWRGYRMVPDATELEYAAMLRLLLLGESPAVTVAGRAWAAPDPCAPVYAGLAAVDGVDRLIAPLARFHASIEQAARRGPDGATLLGGRRREPYVFTRRSLLSVVDHLEHFVPGAPHPERALFEELREALTRCYLDRIVDGSDRQIAIKLLDAAGIGPSTWTLPAPPRTATATATVITAAAQEAPAREDHDELDDELRMLLEEDA